MAKYICTGCKHIGKPHHTKRGSGRTEFTMWMLFPLGIPYTLWRIFSKVKKCSQCGDEFVVRDDSLLGMQILENMERDISGNHQPSLRKSEIEQLHQSTYEMSVEEASEDSKSVPTPSKRSDPNQW